MPAKRHDKFRVRRSTIVITALLTILSAAFACAGRFLVINDAPVQSDAIVVLGGGGIGRILRGSELYNEGMAQTLIVSGGNLDRYQYTESEVMAGQAEQAGVPRNHVILENQSKTTYENAVFTKRIVEARKFRSIIVVSSDYHMRRVQFVFNRVYRTTGVNIIYCSSPTPYFNASRWWSNRRSISIVVSEYGKMVLTFIGLEH